MAKFKFLKPTDIYLIIFFILPILGAFIAVVLPVINRTITTSRKLESEINLKSISKSLEAYKLEITRGYYPCEVGTDKSGTLDKPKWVKASQSTNRSTIATMQVLFDSNVSVSPDAEDLLSPIDCSLFPPERRANGQLEKFQRDNIGYHYVNGSVSQRYLGEEKAIMRDLNEGFECSRVGHVLLASGSVVEVSKQGQRSSDGLNYRVNWYKNRDMIPNYKDFDNYNRKVIGTRPDRVD